MRFAMRKCGGVVLAAVISVVWVLAPVAGSLAPQACAQQSRSADTPSSPVSQYLELEHRSPSEIPPADLSLIRAKQREIAAEAAFFGYDLNASGWDYDQSVCPLLPDELVLHYRRQFRDGAQSLFTALVPRSPGRVFVVPVLYRNATPFRSATGSQRSIAVFNRVVPADVAAKAAQPEGKWLDLGLCYADIVYAHANVLNQSGAEVGLVRAPLPLLHVSEESSLRGITFTDRNAPGQYLVWNLTLNSKGRMTSAVAVQLSDYIARVRNGAEPTAKPMPQGKEPTIKILPPEQDPSVKPTPQ
jgi:hypothetical protein